MLFLWKEKINRNSMRIFFVATLLILCTFLSSCSEPDPADASLKVVRKYMTAMEQNDVEGMMKCLDPREHALAKSIVNVIGGMFGIDNAYDLTINSGGLFTSIMQKASGRSVELSFNSVLSQSYEKNNGVIDAKYDMKINYNDKKPQVAEFSMRFNMIKIKNNWYISSFDNPILLTPLEDSTGKKIIVAGADFSDGVAWVNYTSGWSCVDKEGKILFSLNAGSKPITDFIKGIAIINGDTVINKSGEIISSVKDGLYDSIVIDESYNYNGYVFVKKRVDTFQKTEDQIGVIDSNGNWYIEPTSKIKFARHRGEGMYYVAMDFDANNQLIFLDINTKQFIRTDPYYPQSPSFDNGVSVGSSKYNPICVASKDGRLKKFEIVNPDEDHSGLYREGMFFKGNFYDKDGKIVINMTKYHYNFINSPYFVNGYSIIDIENDQKSKYFTIIDSTGARTFEPRKLTSHGNLSCGLIWVQTKAGYDYIDVNGDTIFSVDSGNSDLKVFDFKEDIAKVVTSKELYYIDKTGKRLF